MRSTFRSKRSALLAKSATPSMPFIVVSSSCMTMSPTSAEVFVSATAPEKLELLQHLRIAVVGSVDADLRQPLAQRHRIELERSAQSAAHRESPRP